MTPDEVRGIIRRIVLKHPEFVLSGVQLQGDSAFITFLKIDRSLATIDAWIRAAGGVPVTVGIEGNGDNETMWARVK